MTPCAGPSCRLAGYADHPSTVVLVLAVLVWAVGVAVNGRMLWAHMGAVPARRCHGRAGARRPPPCAPLPQFD